MRNRLFFTGIMAVLVLVLFSCKEDQITEPQHHHFEAYGMNIIHGDSVYIKVFNAQIDTNYHKSFDLEKSNIKVFKVEFLGENGQKIDYPEDEEMVLGWIISDTSIVKASLMQESKWSFALIAREEGHANIELRLNHIDHPDFKTPLLPVDVK